MEDAIMFEITMRTIWGDDKPDPGFVIRSTVARLRGTQGCNPENACEVLSRVWPEAKCEPRLTDPKAETAVHTYEEIIFDVKFEDGSQCLIVADKYGIGHGVEYVGGAQNDTNTANEPATA